ncbi:helix-turn-helix transcriptional regulator [Sphingobium sp. CAP-1]|uniref:helix-turn-helix transcriptional regulator n=1 Tax=Sphingobium sp. CAP-1 TaxID=2676077 RepID=UPI0012BB3467|nr:helix-turn-helix transcriptional regulator [Sphingobium sp. CAP-1]QGP79604.1 hypothetical protein GL174_11900 [Sphingobium sp. CAP-1]
MGGLSRDHFDQTVAAFAAAPFQPDQWDEGLRLLGEACGGWTAQLLTVDKKGGICVNRLPLMPDDAIDEWERRGGAIPHVNPRAATLFAPAGSITSDDDVLARDAQERLPVYREIFDRFGARFMMVGTLRPDGDRRSVAGVLRTRRQDHPQRADMEVMAALMPHVQAALTMQGRLNDRDLRVALDSLDLIDLAAFLCDSSGRVIARTRAGQALAAAGDVVRVQQGMLQAAIGRQDGPLQAALRRAIGRADDGSGHVCHATIGLTDAAGRPCRVDIAPVPPGQFHFSVDAACIATVTQPRPVGDPRLLLAQAYGLTPTEASVALDLAQGMTASEIAAQRGVSSETVRVQVRAVLRKTDVPKATALAAIIGRFNL